MQKKIDLPLAPEKEKNKKQNRTLKNKRQNKKYYIFFSFENRIDKNYFEDAYSNTYRHIHT